MLCLLGAERLRRQAAEEWDEARRERVRLEAERILLLGQEVELKAQETALKKREAELKTREKELVERRRECDGQMQGLEQQRRDLAVQQQQDLEQLQLSADRDDPAEKQRMEEIAALESELAEASHQDALDGLLTPTTSMEEAYEQALQEASALGGISFALPPDYAGSQPTMI